MPKIINTPKITNSVCGAEINIGKIKPINEI